MLIRVVLVCNFCNKNIFKQLYFQWRLQVSGLNKTIKVMTYLDFQCNKTNFIYTIKMYATEYTTKVPQQTRV